MLRTKVSRIACSTLFVAGGFAGVGGLLLTGAAPAGAQMGACNPSPLLCITPDAAIVHHQLVKVIIKGPASTEIAVTECNANVTGGDANACNSNPADLGKPGGPALTETNANGRGVVEYRVLVSSVKMVGDGYCLPGGDSSGVPCFLIAASVSTQQPVANPAPFTTQ
jgi:hypothetical protein